MADNEIGGREFFLLKGAVPRIRQVTEQITDRGVSGFRRRRLGEQSPEFMLTSQVDMTSLSAARTEGDLYVAFINGAPVNLIKDARNYQTSESVLVAVLDVTMQMPVKRALICADRINNGDYLLTAQWKLMLVPTP